MTSDRLMRALARALRRGGIPLPRVRAFLARCEMHPCGCLDWIGAHTDRGYGRFWLGGRWVYPHRLALAAMSGHPPARRPYALHSCDRPSCVHPAHLRWGNQRENMCEWWVKSRRTRPRQLPLRGAA